MILRQERTFSLVIASSRLGDAITDSNLLLLLPYTQYCFQSLWPQQLEPSPALSHARNHPAHLSASPLAIPSPDLLAEDMLQARSQ